MFNITYFFAFVILNIPLLANVKYETIILKPSDNVISVLKSYNKRDVISYDYNYFKKSKYNQIITNADNANGVETK